MVTVRYLQLLLVRHAQSVGNLQQKMEGQSSTELSALGHQQAQKLGQALAASITQHLATQPALTDPNSASYDLTKLSLSLYSSPMLRASQTAHHLIQELQELQGLQAQKLEQTAYRHPIRFQNHQSVDLQEMHQGIFQGLTWAQAQAQYPELCNQLLSSRVWQPVPQAESLIEARARAHRWVRHILNQHQPGEVVWAVSHAGFLQHLIAVIMGCDRTWKIHIGHTGIFEFWLSDEAYTYLQEHLAAPPCQTLSASQSNQLFNPEKWIVHRFNDCSHLHRL